MTNFNSNITKTFFKGIDHHYVKFKTAERCELMDKQWQINDCWWPLVLDEIKNVIILQNVFFETQQSSCNGKA